MRSLLCALAVATLVALPGALGTSSTAHADTQCPWMDTTKTPDQRAQELLAAMTLDQKITMVHGGGTGGGVGNVAGNAALCIPALHLNDGPEGVGNGKTGVTAFPAPIGMAATFDPGLVRQAGAANGAEHWEKGSNVWLAPGINIGRVPMNGRNFEYFSEDPYLAAQMTVAEVRGAQEDNSGEPVVATAKHYALNNQETGRNSFSMDADPRTIHEIYLPAFEASVEQGHVGSVMCAYNRIDGVYACEQPTFQNTYLKNEFGFDGWVMSDWGATHSTAPAANAGLDMEMPGSTNFGAALKTAVQNGQVPQSRLDDMVVRILRTMFRVGLFEHVPPATPVANVSTPEHHTLVRRLTEGGSVLLKNAGAILPLTGTGKTIAVIGQTASTSAVGTNANNVCTGGGSAAVNCAGLVTPLQGIQQRAAQNGDTVTYDDGANAATAAAAAAQASVAIVFAYYTESEGSDRSTLALDGNGNALIPAVAAANPNTIVVLNTGGPTLMPWLDEVKSVLETWYPGVENGNAVAALLFGDVSPSGKLPETFPKSQTDLPTAGSPQQYPGVPGTDGNVHATYSEGLLVGYRWYDAKAIQPLFCFGHGLSYTSFSYSNLSVAPAPGGAETVSFTVTNTGSRAGAEVAQVYVADPSVAGEPPRQLKGFQKVFLDPGASQPVTVTLDSRAFSHWDPSGGWTVSPGQYGILVGSSSCDFRLQTAVQLPQGSGLKTTGGGWLADSGGHKLNFGYQAELDASGPEGALELNDRSAGVKIQLDDLTSIGPVHNPCGSVPTGANSLEFDGTGSYNGGTGNAFRVCVQDNGEPGGGSDRFYLACTAGCSYNTGARAPDDVIDGGNIQVAQTAATGPASNPKPATVVLEPLLLSSSAPGQLDLFTVAVYDQNQQPIRNASVVLQQLTDNFVTLSAVTDGTGLATFLVPGARQAAEYTAVAGDAQSNAIELDPGP